MKFIRSDQFTDLHTSYLHLTGEEIFFLHESSIITKARSTYFPPGKTFEK